METDNSIYNAICDKLDKNCEVGKIIPIIESYAEYTDTDIKIIHEALRKSIKQKQVQLDQDILILEAINVMKVSRLIDKIHGK